MEQQKLVYPPDQSSYAVEDSIPEYIRVQLKGGAGRYRKDIYGSTKIVNCRWMRGRAEFEYLNAFYRVFKGSVQPFKIDLILEESNLCNVDAWFMPDTFKLSGVKGHTYTVSAQLEIIPMQYCTAQDMELVSVVSQMGPTWLRVISTFEEIMNIRFPEALNGY